MLVDLQTIALYALVGLSLSFLRLCFDVMFSFKGGDVFENWVRLQTVRKRGGSVEEKQE